MCYNMPKNKSKQLIEKNSGSKKGSSYQGWQEKWIPKEYTEEDLVQITANFTTSIGNGKFAEVFKGEIDEQAVAVKKCHANKKGFWENEKEALAELAGHQHIIQLLGVQAEVKDMDEYCLVLDYMPYTLHKALERGGLPSKAPEGGSLPGKAPEANEVNILDWNNTLKVLRQMASALVEVSKKNFVIGDLKPDNVLLDEEYNVKICDFGSAKRVGQEIPSTNKAYAASEILFKASQVTQAADVYSFGVILLQMIMKQQMIHQKPRKMDVPRLMMSCYKEMKDKGKKNTTAHIAIIARCELKSRGHGSILDNTLKWKGCKESTMETIERLGIQCTEEDPSKRPKIDAVLDTLDALEVEP
ncbi:hypothetical protein ACH5RR_037536 [Cinchona calisaya]|uniref:Protein kinase domain-containing protein n=1 Tax=Cinchona calisaya TaxID=153742 RepID=A0ABD2YB67_9GENT